MLKISMKEDPMATTLQLEGKLVGPWACELGRTWRDLWAPAREKRLLLDIRGLIFADLKGRQILGEIVKETGAEILADSPLTHYFASRVAAGSAVDPEER